MWGRVASRALRTAWSQGAAPRAAQAAARRQTRGGPEENGEDDGGGTLGAVVGQAQGILEPSMARPWTWVRRWYSGSGAWSPPGVTTWQKSLSGGNMRLSYLAS